MHIVAVKSIQSVSRYYSGTDMPGEKVVGCQYANS